MEMLKRNYRLFRRLFFGVWIFMIAGLMAIAVTEFFLVDEQRKIVKRETQLINASGQQRALIQRIALLSRFLTLTADPNEQDGIKKILTETIEDLERSHRFLIHGVTQDDLLKYRREDLESIYFEKPYEFDQHLQQFLQEAKSFSSLPNAQINVGDPGLRRLTVISQSKIVNDGLSEIVSIHRSEVDSHIARMHRIDIMILALRFILFGGLTFFVFIPLMRYLSKQFKGFIESNEALTKRTHELRLAHQAALNIMEDADKARRKAEAAKEAVFRLAAIVNSSSDAILSKTMEGIITSWNEGAEELYGYAEDEAVGKHVKMLMPPERRGDFDQFKERLKRGEQIRNYETLRVRKDGTMVAVELTISPIYDESGNIIGGSTIARNITERKIMEAKILESKELFESFMNYSPTVAFMKDEDGKYTYVNKPLEDVFNIRAQNLMGKSDLELFDQETAGRLRQNDLSVLQSGESTETVEIVPVPQEGFRHWMVYRFLVKDRMGNPFIGGVAIDITERLKAEEKIREYMEKLKHSNEELQKFANVIAHDLNEPVHKIVAFGDLILEKDLSGVDPETKDYLGRLKRATIRLGELVDALLQYSRITSRKRTSENVPLNTVISEVLSDIELKIRETYAQINVDLLPSVHGDPVQLRQLFQNLILNSIKFKKEEENPRVQIQARDCDARYVEIEVKDNGVGFDEKYAQKIFAPFQQIHGKKNGNGIGMGLAICKKIAETHDGMIRASSEKGKGSAFFIRLPRA